MAEPFRRILITGITGSGGSYLAEYVAEHFPDVEIHGISRWHSTSRDNLGALGGRAVVHEADLADFGSTFAVLSSVRADAIFHLAAHANVAASFVTPTSVLANNILGTSNLLEAIRMVGSKPSVQMCSTSEVYGQVSPKEVPIREDAPLRPASPYAVSKVAQDLLAGTYWHAYGIPVVRTRMFSYLNPRRADLFATSFARQVARIEAGLQKRLLHGNLESVRTLIDVRDAMAAYWQALVHGEPGEVYNIGGATTITVGEFLDLLIARANVPIPHETDPRLLRPADVTLQIPCVDKFTARTGWRPRIAIEDSIDHLLDHWRRVVRLESAEANK